MSRHPSWSGRQLPRYRSTLSFGYSIGSFATMELLRRRPEQARRVVLGERCRPEARELLNRLGEAAGVAPESNDDLVRAVAHRRDVDAIGVFEKYAERLDPGARHVVLLAPADPGNLGAIMRSQVAFAVPDLALVGRAVDEFSPHVVRASIGAAFSVRVERFATLADYSTRHVRPLYLFSGDGDVGLDSLRPRDPCSLVFGPEWPGLPPEARDLGTLVSIQQSRDVESLNLAVAVGIAIYATRPRHD